MPDNPSNLIRRPYSSPGLTIYGDIRSITRAVGNKGNLDGGAFGAKTGQTG